MNQETKCKCCGELYALKPDCETTSFCDLCAQAMIERLRLIVPKPPQAITWEMGVEILNVLQAELYPIPHWQAVCQKCGKDVDDDEEYCPQCDPGDVPSAEPRTS